MKSFQSMLVFGLILGLITMEIVSPYAVVFAQEQNELSEITAIDTSTVVTSCAIEESIDIKEVTTELADTKVSNEAQDEPSVIMEQPQEASETELAENSIDIGSDMMPSSTSTKSVASIEVGVPEQRVATSSDADEFIDFAFTSLEETGATSSLGSTTIVSGQAIALANVLNMVNTNFVNSEGVVLFSNFFDTVLGAIDFRQYFDTAVSFGCSLISCQGQDVVVNIENDASIDNEIVVVADSGHNVISTAGDAVIETGNAYAGVNLINVANTNLVDSNYLLVTLNAFENVNGDIVFPSLSDFFGTLRSGANSPEVLDIVTTASVQNNLQVGANSGENQTHQNGSSVTHTGNSVASSNVFNQLNSSLVGGQSVSIVFKVHGTWAGEIYGAPDNLGWTEGDDGSIYLFDVGGRSETGSLSMYGTSTAEINNNVSVVALTGENAITDAETAVISTGNAYAGANIINVANANVIGRNWILAVINIFGDFNGNIAFGRPDLFVGGQVEVPEVIQNGSELTYNLTLINNGDSPATNVDLTSEVSSQYLEIIDATVPYVVGEDGKMKWKIAKIGAGGAVEISYKARVRNTTPGIDITTTAFATQRETDENTDDNSEAMTVTTSQKRSGNSVNITLRNDRKAVVEVNKDQKEQVVLEVQRKTSEVIMNSVQNTVEQKLFVRNTTQYAASNVVLHDILSDPAGKVIRDEVWDLGTVLAGEEIEIGYMISFNENAVVGLYTLGSFIEKSTTTREVLHSNNGTIEYGNVNALLMPLSELFTSFDTDTASVETLMPLPVLSSNAVSQLDAPFGIPSALASEETSLMATGVGSGFIFDPVFTLLAFIFVLLGVSLLRFIRW